MVKKMGNGVNRRLICTTVELKDSVKGTCQKCGNAVYYSKINSGKFSELMCNNCFWNDDKLSKQNAYVTRVNFNDSMQRYLKTKEDRIPSKISYADFVTDVIFGNKEKLEVSILTEKISKMNNLLDMLSMGEAKPEAG